MNCTDLKGRHPELLFRDDCCYGLTTNNAPWDYRYHADCAKEGDAFEYCIECANPDASNCPSDSV